MKIFKPFENTIKKQIYIRNTQSEHITEKTIMNQITKSSEYSKLDPESVIIKKSDITKYITESTYVTTEDNSVWTIIGKSKDMDGNTIPSTYDIDLVGKLESIDIDGDLLINFHKLEKSIDRYTQMELDYTDLILFISENIPDYKDLYERNYKVLPSCMKSVLTQYFEDVKKLKFSFLIASLGCISSFIAFIISLFF